MSQVEQPSGMVVFASCTTDSPDGDFGFRSRKVADPPDRDYFQIRERAERAAATQATCVAARSVHQELALQYAPKLRGQT
jgi:hypothetical protein